MPKYRITVTEKWTKRYGDQIVVANNLTQAKDEAVMQILSSADHLTTDMNFIGYSWETELLKEENDG